MITVKTEKWDDEQTCMVESTIEFETLDEFTDFMENLDPTVNDVVEISDNVSECENCGMWHWTKYTILGGRKGDQGFCSPECKDDAEYEQKCYDREWELYDRFEYDTYDDPYDVDPPQF